MSESRHAVQSPEAISGQLLFYPRLCLSYLSHGKVGSVMRVFAFP